MFDFNTMLQGLLGHGAGASLDQVSGIEGMQGPTQGSGITGSLDTALPFLAGSPAGTGGGTNLANLAPILSGLLGQIGGEDEVAPRAPSPYSAQGGPVPQFSLPATNPVSLRNRQAGGGF